MLRRIIFFILTVALCLTAGSCGKSNCKVNIGQATCDIYLLNPDAYNLLHAGGCVLAHGGHKGLWILNTGMDYVVFEASCPLCDVAVDTLAGWDGIFQCPQCETVFNGYDSGYPLAYGSTGCPLYQYSCVQEGSYLHINN